MKKIYISILSLLLLQGATWLKAQVVASDSLALVDVYNAAGGPNWTNQGNWLTGAVSTWSGVTVTGDRVTKLTVESNNMIGTISPSVGKLTELTILQFNGSEGPPVKAVDLHGTIPAEIWNCTKLTRLQIKYTNITGANWVGIGKMTSLSEINFQQTYLKCQLPDSIFTSPALTKAYLHESGFTGTVPTTLSLATKLNRLYLFGNKLTSIPFVDLPSSNAAKVQIYGNFFSFAEVKLYADASANYTGGYSNSYQLAKDTVINSFVAGRKYAMHGKVTSGEAYAWFKDAGTTPVSTNDSLIINNAVIGDTGLYVCKAQSSLVASFEIRSVYKIAKIFDLYTDSLALVDIYNAAGGPNWTAQGNWLTGPVSTWSGVTVTNGRVTKLTLESNNMIGTISPSVGKLTALTTLQFNGSEGPPVKAVDLQGTIPAEIWNCTKLTRLQIKYTNITGVNWVGIGKLTNLNEINFQQTYLKCQLPDSIFTSPALTKAYLHESGFTGTVPSTLGLATKLNRLYLFGNKLSGIPFVILPKSNAAKVQIYGNFFSFAEVKPYADSSANYTGGYSNAYQLAKDTAKITVTAGTSHKFSLKVTGGETYGWFKNDGTTPLSSDSTYTISSLVRADSGTYVCKVQSSLVPSFEIRGVYLMTVNRGTNNNTIQETLCSVFPNPFMDKIEITGAAQIKAVTICDMLGKPVCKLKNVSGTSVVVPVASFKPGIYMVIVETANDSSLHKLVKN